jgi:hypothetical protein
MTTIKTADMEMAMTDGGKLTARIADAGEMAVLRVTLPGGTDMSEALRAVSPNHCEVPHWMFVLSGELHIGHNDGRVDIGKAGDFIYAEPGHRPWCNVDTEFIEVSPRRPIRELLAKVAGG